MLGCMCHSLLVSCDLVPRMMTLPLNHISTLSCVKMAWHPASHNCPMEISEWSPNSWKMCATLALGGSSGMSNSPTWVDTAFVSVAAMTVMGLVAILLLRHFALTLR